MSLKAKAEAYTEERSAVDCYNASIDNRVYCAYLAGYKAAIQDAALPVGFAQQNEMWEGK